MRILVAGATGVIGRRLVPLLVQAGHEVIGITRTLAKSQGLRLMGAEAEVLDVLDANAVLAALRKRTLMWSCTSSPLSPSASTSANSIGSSS